jgi:hypothetical protein
MTDERHEHHQAAGAGDLAPWFEAARADGPEPSDALMARVLADAEALQPRPADPPRGGGAWAEVWRLLGGWPAAAGLAAAGVAGLWIGAAPPEVLAPGIERLAGGGGAFVLPSPEAGFALALDEG